MKNLTFRYSVAQFTYWAAYTGTTSFATTYLLNMGLPAGTVGFMLAAAGLCSCVTQPLLAAAADRAKKFVLIKMMLLISVLCCGCFVVQLIPGLPPLAAGFLYMAGIWGTDSMVPLLNAISVSYNGAQCRINYGMARGTGSVASALSSLAVGYIIAGLGTFWMILFLLGFRVASIIILAGFPTIEKAPVLSEKPEDSSSVLQFFASYKWYCVSLLGFLFLGMYHAMTENYMIAIVGRMGGNSSHVGTALFISCISGAPVIFCSSHIRKRIPELWMLKIAAGSFLLKAVLFYFAENITTIYLLQLLQITSYAFLAPTQVSYASAKVRSCDMVKGQAFITAAYALGCSAGNFAGGQLLGYGVDVMLLSGIVMAAAGTAVMFLTVGKSDREVSIQKHLP